MSAHEEQPVSAQALADLDQALWRGRTLRGLRDAASPQTHRDLLDTILEAGWRPPLPPTPEWQVNARVEEARATSLGYCEHVVEVLSDGEEETCGELRERGSIHCAEHQPTPPAPSVEAAPDGWYPAAMREHDRANAAELDRNAARQRAASWWEAAKRWCGDKRHVDWVLSQWKTAAGEQYARADAAEAKLRQVREVITEDAETRARFNVDTSTSYGPRFLSRIRAIVERESATRCVNDTNGDGDCAACAHNPDARCRSASEEPRCACDRPVARCSCRIADLCKAAADKLDTAPEETAP